MIPKLSDHLSAPPTAPKVPRTHPRPGATTPNSTPVPAVPLRRSPDGSLPREDHLVLHPPPSPGSEHRGARPRQRPATRSANHGVDAALLAHSAPEQPEAAAGRKSSDAAKPCRAARAELEEGTAEGEGTEWKYGTAVGRSGWD
jgi:hypothetical protein